MTQTKTDEQLHDELFVVVPWQEVIRTAHRRALEAERERKLARAAGTDATAPA